MLQISDNQYMELVAREREKFLDALTARLSGEFNSAQMNQEKFRAAVELAVNDAQAFDIRAQNNVAAYVTVTLLAGRRITVEPQLRHKLSSVMIGEKAKVDFLIDWFEQFEDALTGRGASGDV